MYVHGPWANVSAFLPFRFKKGVGGQIYGLHSVRTASLQRSGLCDAVCVIVMTLVCSGCDPISISCHSDEPRHLLGARVSATGCP